jgi:hypothetical protein
MKVDSAHFVRRSRPATPGRAHGRTGPGSVCRPAIVVPRRHAVPWNFFVASLYNAAMFSRRPAARTPDAADAVSMRLLWALAPVALFSSMALASTAHAQAPTTPEKPIASKTGTSKTPAPIKVGKKVITVDEEFLVEGRLEKPSAFYVLRRSSTDYDWARLDAVFTPLVLESVQDPLF